MLAAGLAATLLVLPNAAAAFAPRLAHVVWRTALGVPCPAKRIGFVATRECLELAVFIGLVAWWVR